MRWVTLLACVAGLVTGGDAAATSCEGPCWPRGRWAAPPVLPPTPTVYLLPDRQSYAVPEPISCRPDEPWAPPVWPLLLSFEELAVLLGHDPAGSFEETLLALSLREPARLAWAIPLRVEDGGRVVGVGGEPLRVTAELRLVGHDVVQAFRVDVAAGALVFLEGFAAHSGLRSGPGIPPDPRRVSAAVEPSWSEVRRGGGGSPWDLRVDSTCRAIQLRGAGVGYWVVQTEHCLDRLVMPSEGTEPEPVAVDVPAACVGSSGAVTVIAHLFDGTARRHHVDLPATR